MAQSIDQQFKRIVKDIDRALLKVENTARSQAFQAPIASEAADLIRKRTRLGKGVRSQNGELERLKPLSQSYIDYRLGKAYYFSRGSGQARRVIRVTNNVKKPKLSSFTTARKSNLTFTGQLLDSISARTNRNGIILYLKDKRSDEKSRKYGTTNSKIKDYQEDQGRYFFYLSRTENNLIERRYRDRISELLNNTLIKI